MEANARFWERMMDAERERFWRAAVAAMLLAWGFAGCRESQPDVSCQVLDPEQAWHGTNRSQLDALMKTYGRCASTYNEARKPIAAFDWDNTVIKNDVGDATFFYMLAHDEVFQPPGKNWRLTSPWLTGDAVTALDAACGALVEAGSRLPTSSQPACAQELLTIYSEGKTTAGKAAWGGWNYRRMEPSYAWLAQLLAGHTRAEVRAIAEAAMAENLGNPIDTKQTIGSASVTHWVRVPGQMKDLLTSMQANGFDLWIISASPQAVVEPWAQGVGIDASHVIGIRTLEEGGKLGYNLEGCGDVPNGANDGQGQVRGNSLITYIDGKRCWMNKVLFGVTGAAALEPNPDVSKRPLFAAGDSDTDLTFMRDATALRLAINRNKKELMCNAYRNDDGRWLINPMFIQPRPQQAEPYACATTACKAADGASIPCTDGMGAPIADQADTVF
ncbi:haloacid dehalogenase-like hydrolase [Stigmatella aurantiaca]|nr:HAD family hydrolase [Stigmatella aurantiaca]ADO74489.1 conserved lipoprotein LppF [Stigmatella aurantiaca DW4/3-1]